MRRSILIAVLAGLIVAGLLMRMPYSAQAEILKISAGVSQSRVIWQTEPPPYKETALGAGLNVGVLIRPVTLDLWVAIADLQTMRLYRPFTFGVGGSIGIAHLAMIQLSTRLGVSLQPAYNWISYSLSVGLTTSLARNIDISSSIGISATKGSRRAPSLWWWTTYYPAGWGISVSVAVYWLLFSFP